MTDDITTRYAPVDSHDLARIEAADLEWARPGEEYAWEVTARRGVELGRHLIIGTPIDRSDGTTFYLLSRPPGRRAQSSPIAPAPTRRTQR